MNTMPQTSWLLLVVLLGVSTIGVSAQTFIFFVDPEDATICKGESVSMNCGYFTNNTLGIIPLWIINGASVRRIAIDSNQNDLLQWIVDGDDTNTTRLLVGPVDERFVGRTTFRCEISTERGSDNATLTVIGMPDTPTITVTDIGLDRFTVSWNDSSNDPNAVCGTVKYNVTVSGPTDDEVINVEMNSNTFTGLTNSSSYTVTITPYNNAGAGPPAMTQVITLTPSTPSPPTRVQSSLKFFDMVPSIMLSWMAPQLAGNMTEITQYVLEVTVNESLQVFTTFVPANTTTVDVFSSSPNNARGERYTNYSLRVAAMNSVGQGEFTESLSIETNYIQNTSATPEVGRIIVSCRLAESVPRVICSANPDCLAGVTLTLTNDVPKRFETDQPCNITFQATTDTGVVVEERIRTNVTPIDPFVMPTTTSTIVTIVTPTRQPNRPGDGDGNTGSIVGAVIGALTCVGLIVLIIVCVCWCRYRRRRKLALIPCAIKCTCCTCLLCAYCAKKRRGSMKPMTTDKDKTDTGNSNSSRDSPDSSKSTDAFVVNYKKENTQPEAGYCEVAPQKQVKHDNGVTSEYSVVGSEGNSTKNAPQPVALYSEVEPAPKKNGLVPATSVPSQYSMITQEEDADTNNTVEGMPMYSQVDKSKKTIKVQQLPEYSIVHKPTKAEGKVENYSDLADIGPYPTKRPPQDKVQYTEVTPSDATPPDSGTQYTNVDHINDGPIHLSTDHKVQYSVVQ